MANADTIAAIATSAGVGGVGIVRVSGPATVGIVEAVTGRRLLPRVATFVRFVDDAGAPIDEGLGLFFEGPHSYTGEDVFELQAHGGPVVLNRLLRRCLALGARLAEPGEFTKRAFLRGKLDLAQAEAVADLISARTEHAARSAARSLAGEFSRQIDAFQAELTALRALLEASLDFPEEGTDFLERIDVRNRLKRLQASIARTLQAGRAGKLLHEGLSIVLVGAPNAGKSSIINALCDDDVAIVTPVAGTTRDLVKETIAIDGVPIQIVDTAGLRQATDIVEELGIARTWQAVEGADLVLIVLDERGEAALSDDALARLLPKRSRRLWVHNKIDLLGHPARCETVADESHVWVSATTGAGIDLLHRAILSGESSVGAGDTPFAARERQLIALRSAEGALGAAMSAIASPEIAAEELRLAQAALSQITGEVVADDILGEIFSKFCIGK